MKQLFAALVALASANVLFAQNTALPIICGNEVFSHIVREKHPDLQTAFDATFEQAKLHSQFAVTERSPLTINVVVHIVWKNPEENLADSIIQNQIQVLNQDFNRQNADTANLRSYFQSVAGNAEIHFNLAGIVRVQTNTEFEIDLFGTTLLAELKHSDQGGSDAWPTENYLNIWVCKMHPATIFGIPVAQILGFAFPPADLPNWPPGVSAPTPEEDGVAIDFRVFGSNNPNTVEIPGGTSSLTVKGRTPVHEVGHYLGLRHIWGDGGDFGANDCAQSDGIDDTPFANSQSNFDCDKTRNTCEIVEAYHNDDPHDLVENYMDYASEDCMNMFTKGQVALMRSVLQGPRSGLISSVGTQTPLADAGLQLSPNPAQDRLFVNFDLSKQSDVTVRIIGADGRAMAAQTVRQVPSGQQQIEVDTQRLPTGMYFVELRTAGGLSVRKLQVYR
jgi:hypothetical protein